MHPRSEEVLITSTRLELNCAPRSIRFRRRPAIQARRRSMVGGPDPGSPGHHPHSRGRRGK